METIRTRKIKYFLIILKCTLNKSYRVLLSLCTLCILNSCDTNNQAINSGAILKDSMAIASDKIDSVQIKCNLIENQTPLNANLNSNLVLPFCNFLLSEKLYRSLGSAKVVPVNQLKSAFKNTSTEELVIGVFVGGGKRKLETNLHRGSSDESVYEERFYPDFYYYAFQNYGNMFMMINPDVPQKVFNYKVDGDELIASYCYNDTDKVDKQLRLKPTNDSILINNVYCKIWIKNGSQRFIDISFLADSINTDNFNINHQYFQEVLERFVQLKCGKRDEMYTTDYEIVL